MITFKLTSSVIIFQKFYLTFLGQMMVSLLTLRRRGSFGLDNFLLTESKARYINHITWGGRGPGGLKDTLPSPQIFFCLRLPSTNKQSDLTIFSLIGLDKKNYWFDFLKPTFYETIIKARVLENLVYLNMSINWE